MSLFKNKKGEEGDLKLFKTILVTGTIFFVILGIVIFIVYFDFSDWFGGLGGPFQKIGQGLGKIPEFFKKIPSFIKNIPNSVKTGYKNFLSWGPAQKTKEALGFNKGAEQFWEYFFVGLIAGVMAWIIFHFKEFKRYLIEGKPRNVMKPDFREEKDRWMEFIGGYLWKIPLWGMAYAVLMFIPILNRVLQALTLEFLGNMDRSFFVRPLILVIWVVLVPSLVDKYMILKVEGKYEKAITKAKRLSILAEESDKEKRES